MDSNIKQIGLSLVYYKISKYKFSCDFGENI